ncbi:MAG: hypothetical protein PHQ65_07790 [Bacteroidales bacterium]|nr:hypothetical protein [Bacteroidales bacterium]MDD3665151.1 hypothetical protein [Bacteroidales bacterium]
MARTIQEIYDSLNTVKTNMTELNGYVTESGGTVGDNAKNLLLDADSGSKIANWRLWLWVVAVASFVVEGLFDTAKAYIASVVNATRPHTLRWYEQEAKKWQYGHEITWIDDDHYGYLVDDALSRIVTDVAATEADDGSLTIKAVKRASGFPVALATHELQSFTAFWARWKDAGVRVAIVSQNPNVLDIQAVVLRDRLVLAEDGTLIRDSSVNTLQVALDTWLNNLQFNGVIRITDIEQAAKTAEGIIDFSITFLWIADYTETSWQQVAREVVPSSGFAVIDYERSDFNYVDE